MTLRLSLDRSEGDRKQIAVLLTDDGTPINFPKALLPKGSRLRVEDDKRIVKSRNPTRAMPVPVATARPGDSHTRGRNLRSGWPVIGDRSAADLVDSSPGSIDDASGASRWIGELPPEVGPVHEGHC